jgi:hypothetical protein
MLSWHIQEKLYLFYVIDFFCALVWVGNFNTAHVCGYYINSRNGPDGEWVII